MFHFWIIFFLGLQLLPKLVQCNIQVMRSSQPTFLCPGDVWTLYCEGKQRPYWLYPDGSLTRNVKSSYTAVNISNTQKAFIFTNLTNTSDIPVACIDGSTRTNITIPILQSSQEISPGFDINQNDLFSNESHTLLNISWSESTKLKSIQTYKLNLTIKSVNVTDTSFYVDWFPNCKSYGVEIIGIHLCGENVSSSSVLHTSCITEKNDLGMASTSEHYYSLLYLVPIILVTVIVILIVVIVLCILQIVHLKNGSQYPRDYDVEAQRMTINEQQTRTTPNANSSCGSGEPLPTTQSEPSIPTGVAPSSNSREFTLSSPTSGKYSSNQSSPSSNDVDSPASMIPHKGIFSSLQIQDLYSIDNIQKYINTTHLYHPLGKKHGEANPEYLPEHYLNLLIDVPVEQCSREIYCLYKHYFLSEMRKKISKVSKT